MKAAKFAIISLLAIFFVLFLIFPVYTVVSEGLHFSYLIEIIKDPVVTGLAPVRAFEPRFLCAPRPTNQDIVI